MQGFLEESFLQNYDVCIFSMYLKFQSNMHRQIGDSNIFHLINNYDLFDAFIILADSIQAPGVFDMLENTLYVNFSGPVLVVDRESRHFPYIFMDHYTPAKTIIDHLIEEHHYQNIVYLSGKIDHIHSKERVRAFKDSLTQHNIPFHSDQIFYGDYWYSSGEEIAQTLLNRSQPLPEAIACANDFMALGVCSVLEQNGIQIPEDIAVIGFDSIEEGHKNKTPITSAHLPSKEFGTYCANWIHQSLENQNIPNIDKIFSIPDTFTDHLLMRGTSCGCRQEHIKPYEYADHTPKISHFSKGFFSYLNHMTEDLLSQTTYENFFNTVFEYIYHIRDFESFHLCLNDNWDVTQHGVEQLHNGYTSNVVRVIRCGKDHATGNSLSFSDTFEQAKLLPELSMSYEKPQAYIFTPLHFDDVSLGYAVISYGNKPKVYDQIYHMWLRNVMQGLESFNRRYALSSLIHQMEATQIRDSLTGLYNLRGFLSQLNELSKEALLQGNEIIVIAIDMNGLHEINDTFGRREGDRAIVTLSQIIQESVHDNEICSRMCNDEFLIGYILDATTENREAEIATFLSQRTERCNQHNTDHYEIDFYFFSKHSYVTNDDELELLVNETVSLKNKQKALRHKQLENSQGLTAEDIENDRIVAEILDQNLFTYHFQPIVSAFNGEIFSYEALMRSDTTTFVSPLTIIKSAERMNRLGDIEMRTFTNILRYISQNPTYFANRKIFINSIPGCKTELYMDEELLHILDQFSDSIVVEFTEESEIDDTTLTSIKTFLGRYNIQIAIDDYGSGYSNTNNLLRYMPNYLKIDRMLITDIQNNPQKQYFVKTIIDYAHDNDILALAEGVETTKELKEVIRLGADLIQGFYTAKPQAVPIERIDERVINEIIQYNQTDYKKLNRKEYVAKASEKISLLQLVIGEYSHIVIPGDFSQPCDIELIGASGFHSNLSIIIENGFCGTVSLNNVSLGGPKQLPCIDIEDCVELTLILEGENELRTGGIHVPESSAVTFKGDGSLDITTNYGHYFGIGNDLNSRHGKLVFDQDGGIIFNGNGMQGVGIGSGLGGIIQIQRGWYRFTQNGKNAIGIGSYEGNDAISIMHCDIEFHLTVTEGVAIGSYSGDINISLSNISGKVWASGTNLVGIGSLYGQHSTVNLDGGYFILNIRSAGCIGLGGASDTQIDLRFAAVNVYTLGKQTYAMGNQECTAIINCVDCDFSTNINNNLDSDYGAREENISLINCRCDFIHNEQTVARTTKQILDI